MSATAQTTTASSHADVEETLRAATQWLQSNDQTAIPPFLQQSQQPPAGSNTQFPPQQQPRMAQSQDDSPSGFRKLQTVPTPPVPLDVQVGGAGFGPGAQQQQQQAGQQTAGGITMTAEDIAALTSKSEVKPQGAESAETPLLADTPSSSGQAAIEPMKLAGISTAVPPNSDQAAARMSAPSTLDSDTGMSGKVGAGLVGDTISDVIDWKVGAASLAVAIVLWFIFA